MIELLKALALVCQINYGNMNTFYGTEATQSQQRKCVANIFSCMRLRRPKILIKDEFSSEEILTCL